MNANAIDTFLSVNAADIRPATCARIRECVAKGATRTATELVPDYLQDAFRGILEAMYRERVAGQKFNAKAEVMPTPGKPDSKQSKNCRL